MPLEKNLGFFSHYFVNKRIFWEKNEKKRLKKETFENIFFSSEFSKNKTRIICISRSLFCSVIPSDKIYILVQKNFSSKELILVQT